MPCLYGFKSIRVSPLNCKVRAPQVRFRELSFAVSADGRTELLQ